MYYHLVSKGTREQNACFQASPSRTPALKHSFITFVQASQRAAKSLPERYKPATRRSGSPYDKVNSSEATLLPKDRRDGC